MIVKKVYKLRDLAITHRGIRFPIEQDNPLRELPRELLPISCCPAYAALSIIDPDAALEINLYPKRGVMVELINAPNLTSGIVQLLNGDPRKKIKRIQKYILKHVPLDPPRPPLPKRKESNITIPDDVLKVAEEKFKANLNQPYVLYLWHLKPEKVLYTYADIFFVFGDYIVAEPIREKSATHVLVRPQNVRLLACLFNYWYPGKLDEYWRTLGVAGKVSHFKDIKRWASLLHAYAQRAKELKASCKFDAIMFACAVEGGET